jgi:hypothetical protein
MGTTISRTVLRLLSRAPMGSAHGGQQALAGGPTGPTDVVAFPVFF